MVQFSHLYMPNGKTITLTLQTSVRKVISHVSWFLICCLVILFLPRSKHLLILQLQSPSAVILEPKIKSVPVSTFSPSVCHKVMELDDVLLVYTHTCTHTHTHKIYIIYIYIFTPCRASPHSHSTPLGPHRAPVRAPCVIQQFPSSCLFYM